MPWRPLLDGEAAARALAAAEEIAGAFASAPGWFPGGSEASAAAWHASLGSGAAGQALLHGYLALHGAGEEHADAAVELLNRAAGALPEVPMRSGLYSGFAGIAWAVQHLARRLLGEDDDEDPNEDVDAALLAELERSPWPGDYDLINGLVGFGVYALERLPRPVAAECLTRVIERLGELAERSPEGTSWFSDPASLPGFQREAYPRGLYNLGVAHGVPGVVGLLGAACASGVAPAAARPLLDGAVAWLLARRIDPALGSCFTHMFHPEVEPRPSRLAWCYGDPGIAATLLLAARAAGEPAWERAALAIARAAAARPAETSRVEDACLCHGAAGLGHLFNRLYQATGDEPLAEAARAWLAHALDLRRPGRGVAGFSSLSTDLAGDRDWRADPGFLEGAAGVGLALLAAASPVEPEWDRLLLVSIPPC